MTGAESDPKAPTMYLRRTTRPRIVTLPDGRVLSLADLPPRNTRWVASRKAAVVAAVTHGLLPRQEALDRYGLSEEEFDGWIAAMERHGVRGLRVTAVQNYKQPKIE